jgi:lathosterol oxidase
MILNILNILLSIIIYDIWFYISHVLLHTKYFYKYHREHHLKLIPNFLDTYKASIIENLVQGLGIFLPLLFINYNIYQIGLIFIILNIRAIMQHDERCIFIIGNHHLVHHKYQNCNYGTYWIDYLFNTLRH